MCPSEVELIRYEAGALLGDRAVEVREHLDQCERCRSLVKHQRAVGRLMAAWKVEPPPDADAFTDRVMRSAVEARLTRSAEPFNLRPMLRYAAVMAISAGTGLALGLLTSSEPGTGHFGGMPAERLVNALGLDDWAPGSVGPASELYEALDPSLTPELSS